MVSSPQVYNVHKALSPISPMFSIAAAFGNVHGVYKVDNNFHFLICYKLITFTFSVRQRGAVPPPAEGPPAVCQGAVEVLGGETTLPGHARRQWVQ